MGTEESNLDSLEGFNVCGDGEDDFQTGGACLWIIDEEKFNALPADQQGGFHNTQINANVAELFTSNNSLRRSHFTGESADEDTFVLNARRANRINDEDGFYAHTHMAYDNDAFLRVYTYQRVAERNYPGRIQKVCFCDWRKLAGVAEQTDCTRRASTCAAGTAPTATATTRSARTTTRRRAMGRTRTTMRTTTRTTTRMTGRRSRSASAVLLCIA